MAKTIPVFGILEAPLSAPLQPRSAFVVVIDEAGLGLVVVGVVGGVPSVAGAEA